ncbi:MAG: VUT family protein [Bacilli bacterium]|nr:VUT family protein [Bacilli bacterium]
MTKIKNIFRNFIADIKTIPGILLGLFIITVILMNIFARQTIYQNNLIAIDGGIIITWVAVVISDVVTITRGPKATIKMTILATATSLFVSLILYLISFIPGVKNSDIYTKVFSGTWFVIISSAIAFVCSNSFDAILNHFIGNRFKDSKNKVAITTRVIGSTAASTLLDNLIFNIFTFMIFAPIFLDGFHWTFVQCLFCALTYAGIEIVIEVLMLPITYKCVKKIGNN